MPDEAPGPSSFEARCACTLRMADDSGRADELIE
jgi:hypothetical protein